MLNETPPEKLEAALAPILDVDGALKFLALDVVLVNSDGFWTRASDYSIYEDEKGRFHVIPHDMNEALVEEGFGPPGRGRGPGGPPPDGMFPPPGGGPPGGFGGGPRGGRGFGPGGGGPDLDPLVGLDDTSKALRARLLAVPALRTRYMGYVHDIAEKWLDWKKLDPIVRARQALIAADVKVDGRKLYSTEAFSADVRGSDDSLQRFIEKRREFLLKPWARASGARFGGEPDRRRRRPDHQRVRQRDRLRGRGPALQDVEEQAHRALADLAHRLRDGRQRRVDVAGEADVVEAHDRQVARHAHAALPGRVEHADRHLVVEAEDRGRRRRLREQPIGGLGARTRSRTCRSRFRGRPRRRRSSPASSRHAADRG